MSLSTSSKEVNRKVDAYIDGITRMNDNRKNLLECMTLAEARVMDQLLDLGLIDSPLEEPEMGKGDVKAVGPATRLARLEMLIDEGLALDDMVHSKFDSVEHYLSLYERL
jgi:hypothetical protein